MVDAYNYRIEYSNDCYRVYLEETLFASIVKKKKNTWHIHIKNNSDYYRFIRSGFLRFSFCIKRLDIEEDTGTIYLPLVPFLLPKYKFVRKDGIKMYWISRNFFSFHWVWKQQDNLMAEAVEDIGAGRNNGVIKMFVNDAETKLLLMAGLFFSIRRKQRLLPGFTVLNKM